MTNKTNHLPPQVVDFTEENSVHIAGGTGAEVSGLSNDFNTTDTQSHSALGVTCTAGAVSSVGRAGASHASGREFETLTAHHFPSYRRFATIWDQGFSGYFWKRVHVGAPAECWAWKATPNADGYGQIKVGNRVWIASRLALALALGRELAVNAIACHHCDNRICCNPAHIYEGTKASNHADAKARGRLKSAPGEKNHFAKLTADQVANIRHLFSQGKSNTAIGQLLGVHHSTISKIRTGASW